MMDRPEDRDNGSDDLSRAIGETRRDIDRILREGESSSAALAADAAARRYSARQGDDMAPAGNGPSVVGNDDRIVDESINRLGAIETALLERQDRFLRYVQSTLGSAPPALAELLDPTAGVAGDPTAEIVDLAPGGPFSSLDYRARFGALGQSAWLRLIMWTVLVVVGGVVLLITP